jgi:hypothetical protein
LRGVTSGYTEGTIVTGGFSYDQATLEDLIKEWLSLYDDYDRSYRDTRRLVLVEGPGLDFASDGLAGAANSYGEAYRRYLRQNREYCLTQAQLCQNALDDYLGVERRNVVKIENSDQPVDDGSDQGI